MFVPLELDPPRPAGEGQFLSSAGTAQPANPLPSGLVRCYVAALRDVEAFDPDGEGGNPVTTRPIVRFPDPRLRLKAEPIMAIDEGIRGLARDLTETMHAAPGIGITAPHIGILKRLVVIQLESDPLPHIYINPQIVWTSSDVIRHTEGSVSMPGVTDEIERYSKVRVTFRGLDGAEQEEEAEGLMAICLQHEIDQLDGIFWIDRLSRLKRDRLIKRFEKLERVRT
jgi:peptide deformylase